MRLQRLTLENKVTIGIVTAFLLALTYSVVSALVRGPVAVSKLWWISTYYALSLIAIPIVISIGFYYVSKWDRPYPFGLVMFPNLMFLLIFARTPAASYTFAAISLSQIFFLFPRLKQTPTLKFWAYVYWTLLYIAIIVLLTLLVQLLTSALVQN
jgi:hypothetical protein